MQNDPSVKKKHFPPDNTRNLQPFFTLTLTGDATTVKINLYFFFVKLSRKSIRFQIKNY